MSHIWKFFAPKLWVKMLSDNPIARFFNQPYLQSKSVKYRDFLHGFSMFLQFAGEIGSFRKGKSCFNDFWVGMVKNGHGYLIHETLKSAVS